MKSGRVFVLFFLTLLPAGKTWSLSLVRGPYLQMGTPSSMVLRWRTDVSSTSKVSFGRSEVNLEENEGDSSLVLDHRVKVKGLEPGTRYFYAVGSPDVRLAGGDKTHFFSTHPGPENSRPTRIWVLGDAGTQTCGQLQVKDAYARQNSADPADLILLLGDNAYNGGLDSEYQKAFFQTYQTFLKNTELWPVLGNHELESGLPRAPYFDIFSIPSQGQSGGVASGSETYFSFDYGNIHFIALDGNGSESPRSANGPMAQWLKKDLAADQKEWTVAYWHQPPYSKGFHDSDIEDSQFEMRQNIVPILEQGGVDLVLNGHSHAYERSYLLDGHYGDSHSLKSSMILDHGDGREDGKGAYHKPAGRQPHQGAVYVVAGSAGSIDGGDLDHPAHFVSLNRLGSVVLEVNGNRLDEEFLDYRGAIEDHFTLVKGNPTTAGPAWNGKVESPGARKGVRLVARDKALPQGGLLSSVASATEKAFPKSLAISLVNADGRPAEAWLKFQSRGKAIKPKDGLLTFRVWVPEGEVISGLEPYLQDNRHNWIGEGIHKPVAGAWNELELMVPCEAVLPLEEIGCHFFSQASGTARAYLDGVGGLGKMGTLRASAEGSATSGTLFDFEDGSTQGWSGSGGYIPSVSVSREKSFAGKRSLAVELNEVKEAETSAHIATVSGIFSPRASSQVDFHLWIPEHSPVKGIAPYFETKQQAWTGQEQDGLKPGAWNTLSMTLPANLKPEQFPLAEIGCWFFLKPGPACRVYLDDVELSRP
jgi:hypothetical protein